MGETVGANHRECGKVIFVVHVCSKTERFSPRPPHNLVEMWEGVFLLYILGGDRTYWIEW